VLKNKETLAPLTPKMFHKASLPMTSMPKSKDVPLSPTAEVTDNAPVPVTELSKSKEVPSSFSFNFQPIKSQQNLLAPVETAVSARDMFNATEILTSMTKPSLPSKEEPRKKIPRSKVHIYKEVLKMPLETLPAFTFTSPDKPQTGTLNKFAQARAIVLKMASRALPTFSFDGTKETTSLQKEEEQAARRFVFSTPPQFKRVARYAEQALACPLEALPRYEFIGE